MNVDDTTTGHGSTASKNFLTLLIYPAAHHRINILPVNMTQQLYNVMSAAEGIQSASVKKPIL